jgi:hypothetical protein
MTMDKMVLKIRKLPDGDYHKEDGPTMEWSDDNKE